MLKAHRKSSSMALAALAMLAAGCQIAAKNQQSLLFAQTPPAVQSAFLAYYSPDATIQRIEREQMGGQDYYTFTFTDKDQKSHEVELNEGGDQVDQH